MKIKNWITNRLAYIVGVMIRENLFTHKGKFKIGDIVTYNWKAKIIIASAIKDYPGPHIITSVISYTRSDGIEWKDHKFYGTSGADAFWLRKVYFWESKKEIKYK
jgi:hypothetical protein